MPGLTTWLTLTSFFVAIQGCEVRSSEAEVASGGSVHLYFFSPELLDTYGAITEKNIEDSANCSIEIASNADAAVAFRKMISRARPGAFDVKNVRLKATGLLPQAIVLIDNKGGTRVRDREVQDKELSEGDFRTHREILDALAQEYGCRIEGLRVR